MGGDDGSRRSGPQMTINKRGNQKGQGRGAKGGGRGRGGNRPARSVSNDIDCHTIMLVQFREKQSTRTYEEYENFSGAVQGLCQMFEQALKLQATESGSAKYTLEELWEFIDELQDIVVLTLNEQTGEYKPHDREWIKRRVFEGLKGQAH